MSYDPLRRIYKEMDERIPGGLGANKNISELLSAYAETSVLDILQALVSGVQVEMEHTDDDRVALEIAFDHLLEDIEYYEKLKTVHVDH